MRKTVFITGAAGFIGRHVARTLATQGWRVIGVGYGNLVTDETRTWGIEHWQSAEVTLDNLEALAVSAGEPDAVIHCAGSGLVGYSFEHPRNDFLGNVLSTLDVLEFARLRTGRVRVAVPSSAAVYGAVAQYPITEDTPLSPISPYGVHKVMAEDLCRSYAAFWQVPVCIVRLFSIFGAGLRKQLLWDACHKAHARSFRFFGTGEELRDWLHVNDAAMLMSLALEHAAPDCPTVNGGSGEGMSIQDMLGRFGKIWQPNLQPDFTGETKAGDPAHYVADTSQIRAWGFTPQVSLDEGLADYIRWFRQTELLE